MIKCLFTFVLSVKSVFWCFVKVLMAGAHTHIMVDMFLSDKKLQTLFIYRKMAATPKKMKCCVFSLFMLWVHKYLTGTFQIINNYGELCTQREKIVLVTICQHKQSWCAWMFLILIYGFWTRFDGNSIHYTYYILSVYVCDKYWWLGVFLAHLLKKNDICN